MHHVENMEQKILMSFIGSFVIVSILTILIVYLLYTKKKDKRKSSLIRKELEKSKLQLESLISKQDLILKSLNFGLIFIDTDFYVQWENTDSIESPHIRRKYIPGKMCFEALKQEKEFCSICPLKAAMKTRSTITRLLNIDNMDFEVTASPVYEADGQKLIGTLLRIEDITEKVKVYKMLREAKEKAEESNKIKTAFLANIRHEIRTPLNCILGFSDLISVTDDENEKQEYMKILRNNSNLLLRLLDDIMELSALESGKFDLEFNPVNINELIDSIVVLMENKVKLSEVKIQVVERIPECIINMDYNKLGQLITNLVDNACKFTRKGSIDIGYRFASCNNELYFYVRDTGIGIPSDKQKVIFDRFIKLNSCVPGTGLGLSICSVIVEKLNGTIGVDSEEGKGSCFWFKIPISMTTKLPADENIRINKSKESA